MAKTVDDEAGPPECGDGVGHEAGDEFGRGHDVVDELRGLSGERKELVTSAGAHGREQLRADLGRVDAGGVRLELVDERGSQRPRGERARRSGAA